MAQPVTMTCYCFGQLDTYHFLAATDAEVAAAEAAEAANKAQAAKQLADGFAQDAEKWAAAAELPPADTPAAPAPPAGAATTGAAGRPSTASVNAVAKSAGVAAASTAAVHSAAPGAGLGAAAGPGFACTSLQPPGSLPAALAELLHEEWVALEAAYVQGMGRGFAGLRQAQHAAVNQVAADRAWFAALLQQPDARQRLLQDFVVRFNAVELDMRKADETKVSRA